MNFYYLATDEGSVGTTENRHDAWFARGIAVASGYQRNHDNLSRFQQQDLLAMCVKGIGIVGFGSADSELISTVTDPLLMVNPSEPFEFHRKVSWFLDIRSNPLSGKSLEVLGCAKPTPHSVREVKNQDQSAALAREVVRQLAIPTIDQSLCTERARWISRVGVDIRPAGVSKPAREIAQTTVIARDPAVRAWVMQRSKGICEQCNLKAPFRTLKGEPYLECHHVELLSSDGADTVYNTAALCPNCHREQHHGVNADRLRARLAEQVNSKELLWDSTGSHEQS